MSKFDEAMENYRSTLSTIEVDEALLDRIAKDLGPSIYLADASLVACSDQTELDRVKNNFLIGKLGCEDGPALDEAISSVCNRMKGIQNKYRAVFYYLLVVEQDLAHKVMN